ncbi:MAG: MTH1187 family thiamine-binding protein [Acidobacteriota bacterium]
MNNSIVEVTIVPLGTSSTSLSYYVAEVEKVLKKYKELNSTLTPMSTIIEGDLDLILEVIREMHETPFIKGADRVSTRILIDDRRDKEASMAEKIKAVKSKL